MTSVIFLLKKYLVSWVLQRAMEVSRLRKHLKKILMYYSPMHFHIDNKSWTHIPTKDMNWIPSYLQQIGWKERVGRWIGDWISQVIGLQRSKAKVPRALENLSENCEKGTQFELILKTMNNKRCLRPKNMHCGAHV